MKKHKIKLSHTPKIRWLNETKTHGIGGFTNSIDCVLILSNDEYKKLNKALLKRCKEQSAVCLALYDFTHSNVCSKHHKYKIWKTFDGVSDIDYKYLGSNEQ